MRKEIRLDNERGNAVFFFQTRSFWRIMNIPQRIINKRFEDYFGEDKEITDRNTAINVLKGIVDKIQKRMVHR